MNNEFNSWLKNNPQIPGVLACAVRYPDRSTFTRVYSTEISEAVTENALRCVAETFLALKNQKFPAPKLRWTFENAYLDCFVRTDGIHLGVFSAKDPNAATPEKINKLIAEFQNARV